MPSTADLCFVSFPNELCCENNPYPAKSPVACCKTGVPTKGLSTATTDTDFLRHSRWEWWKSRRADGSSRVSSWPGRLSSRKIENTPNQSETQCLTWNNSPPRCIYIPFYHGKDYLIEFSKSPFFFFFLRTEFILFKLVSPHMFQFHHRAPWGILQGSRGMDSFPMNWFLGAQGMFPGWCFSGK